MEYINDRHFKMSTLSFKRSDKCIIALQYKEAKFI